MPLTQLIALLMLAAAGASKPVPAFSWPTPDIIEETEVPGFVRAGGVPMKLRAVRVRHRVGEMIHLYVEAFQKARFYIPPPKDQVEWYREPALTALDTSRTIAYTVIFQAHADGTTTLILGESNLGLRENAGPNTPPVFPAATGVLRSQFEGAESVVYQTNAAPEDVRSYYVDVLKQARYQPGESDGVAQVFKREQSEIRITATHNKNGGTQVLVIYRGSPQERIEGPAP